MRKKILILHTDLSPGGAETALLGLLHALAYDRVEVTLFLYAQRGEWLSRIPREVTLLPEIPAYRALMEQIVRAAGQGNPSVALARLRARITCGAPTCRKQFSDYGYVCKLLAHRNALRYLPDIPGAYDLAVSFNDPHWILGQKTHARRKVGWFHTDFSRITVGSARDIEERMWAECDDIVTVSEACKAAFDAAHPSLAHRTTVIENLLPRRYIVECAGAISVDKEMPKDGRIRLLSVGRYCHAKNFDSVPELVRRLVTMGLDVVWYLIGYGTDEALIRRRIRESGVGERVILLGKKTDPYPYIAACDLYVQPSRYEGKSITVREAQLLGRPVAVAAYPTAADQVRDGLDGVILPQDTRGLAEGLATLLRCPGKMRSLAAGGVASRAGDDHEIEKVYRLLPPERKGDISDEGEDHYVSQRV